MVPITNRPPTAHPGPNGGNLHSHANSGVTNSEQQDLGQHSTSQDPGSSSHPQHPVFARPLFYVHAPPPPPFLHYQWPMPLSYNPFAGFPGMGYGMVMPPFPPPPYMEPPAYFLPRPHLQPVDYRRFLHPQVHIPVAPHQNPNQTYRVRPPHPVPVRETVNSEVQTEPTQRGIGGYDEGCPLVSSDSGQDTALNSPSSTSSSYQKPGSAEVENYTLPHNNTKDSEVNGHCANGILKRGYNIIHPTGMTIVQSCIRATEETQKCREDPPLIPLCRNVQRHISSVSSPDSLVPVCSSSQKKDEVVKVRRISVPDILMSWGSGTPQTKMLKMADKELPQNDDELSFYENEVEPEKSVNQSPPESDPEVADSADNDDAEGDKLLKILRLPSTLFEPFLESRRGSEHVGLVGSPRHYLPSEDESLQSHNASHKLPDNELENDNETNPHEDTTEIIPYQMSSSSRQMKRKMNESIWSVESLPTFIPNQEWLLQNNMFEPLVTVEMSEEAEIGRLSTQNDKLIVKASKERRRTRRFSFSGSVPLPESWLFFSPAKTLAPPKNPETENETNVSKTGGPAQGQSMSPPEKGPLASPTPALSIVLSTPIDEDVDQNGSSEPEADLSPNQKSFIINEQQETKPGSPEEETLLLNPAAEEISSTGQLILQNQVDMEVEAGARGAVSQVRHEGLRVPVADQKMAKVSPSKGHLVDCGIQCTVLQDHKCFCEDSSYSMEPNRRHPFKYADVKKANDGKAEELCNDRPMQKYFKRSGQLRNRGQDKQSGQEEAYKRYNGKPGKSKGGKGTH